MRVIIFLLLLASSADAQVNRSARELARTNIRDYIVQHIIRDSSYSEVSLGALEPIGKYDRDISWTIEYTFEHAVKSSSYTDKKPVHFHFIFYLDKKMRIFRAESILQDTQ